MPLPDFPTGLKTFEAIQSEPTTTGSHADIEDVLLAADAIGVVDVASEDAKKAREAKANRVREKTIIGRLKMLGYLPRNKQMNLRADAPDLASFLAAVRRLRRPGGRCNN